MCSEMQFPMNPPAQEVDEFVWTEDCACRSLLHLQIRRFLSYVQ
jgi:hypothetical protein